MTKTLNLAIAFIFVAIGYMTFGIQMTTAQDRPNILWLVAEDTSPWIGCYGDTVNAERTPNIDAMADSGVLFTRAYVNAPVCSACRSGFIVGANQIRFGAHEHRSGRTADTRIYLPNGLKAIPTIMQEAGYLTFNVGKTDYNFSDRPDDAPLYANVSAENTKTPWRECADGQPFFGQIQLKGGKNNTSKYPTDKKTDRTKVTIPGDYPQNELYREVVAEHYDSIRMDDERIGEILQQLEEDGLSDSTIVVYFGDHGANHLVRHKQMPTEAGLHVPFVVNGPERWVPSGRVRNDLISTLDLTATTLAWAGLPKPDWYEGRDLFADDFEPSEFIASARDRCDHTIERVRTLRTDQFRYTRNFMLDRVLLQPQYRDNQPYLMQLREMYADGTLPPKLAEIYFGERQPEELFDIENDPAQRNNLAKDPAYQDVLLKHRKLMDGWLAKGDMGEADEPSGEIRAMLGQRWGCVNPEYERERDDTDGDGLTDGWETINGRDPKDGKLLFLFDCGGWQTEGWESLGGLTNIAGRQGFLDFDLLQENASIMRDGLQLDAAKNSGSLVVRIRADNSFGLAVQANGKLIGGAKVEGSESLGEVRFPLNPGGWTGTIRQLKLDFTAPKSTTVEIDSIRVE